MGARVLHVGRSWPGQVLGSSQSLESPRLLTSPGSVGLTSSSTSGPAILNAKLHPVCAARRVRCQRLYFNPPDRPPQETGRMTEWRGAKGCVNARTHPVQSLRACPPGAISDAWTVVVGQAQQRRVCYSFRLGRRRRRGAGRRTRDSFFLIIRQGFPFFFFFFSVFVHFKILALNQRKVTFRLRVPHRGLKPKP